MSSWQRAQASDSMKNFAGILRLPATCAELGKKAPVGPSPSPSMVRGATEGFWIANRLLHDSRRYHEAAPIMIVTISIATTMPRVLRDERFSRIQQETKIATAIAAVITCTR